MLRFSFLMLIFALLLSSSVLAVGVAPAKFEVAYNPGEEQTLTFYVHGDVVEPSLGGGLAEYAYFEGVEEGNSVNCGGSCAFTVKLNVPNIDDSYGWKTLHVGFRQAPPEVEYGQPALSAISKVVAVVTMMVPYPDKYVELDLITASSFYNFQRGNKIYFWANVKSYGQEAVNSVTGNVSIMFNDELVDIVPLTPLYNIPPLGSGTMYSEWITDESINVGWYSVIANVTYDGLSAYDYLKYPLEIGDKVVKVASIDKSMLYVNKINRLGFEIESHWNEDIDVYVEARLKDGDNVIASATSSTITVIASGSEKGSIFLDLSSLTSEKQGMYLLEMESFYDDLSYLQEFTVNLTEADETYEEPAVSQQPSGAFLKNNLTVIILISIIALILTIVTIILLTRGKGKSNEINYEEQEDEF